MSPGEAMYKTYIGISQWPPQINSQIKESKWRLNSIMIFAGLNDVQHKHRKRNDYDLSLGIE